MSSQGDNVFREQEAAAAGNQQQPQAQTQVVKRYVALATRSFHSKYHFVCGVLRKILVYRRRFIVDWELNSALRLLRVANMLGGIAMIVLGTLKVPSKHRIE